MILSLYAAPSPVTPEAVLALAKLTPLQRLEKLSVELRELAPTVTNILHDYQEFMVLTGMSKEDLYAYFEEGDLSDLFRRAELFGDRFHDLALILDAKYPEKKILRYLGI